MTVTINIRVSKQDKQLLKEAAAQEGKTLSALLRESATEEANNVLQKKRGWRGRQRAQITGPVST
jgi:uncharacterized protein (DUF1778 family)